MQEFYSNGKLLLTAEYLVLDGASALAIPTKFGQLTKVVDGTASIIDWKSYDDENKLWFEAKLAINKNGVEIISSSNFNENDSEIAGTLKNILNRAHLQNPEILKNSQGFKVSNHLNFKREWGLGTSSTLINNIAKWFKIDPYQLLKETFGGSGYDIAAANSNSPIIFQLYNSQAKVLNVNFELDFQDNVFFVYLNHKQNSRASINHYKSQTKEFLDEAVTKATSLTESFITCESLDHLELLIEIHENLISNVINIPKIKSQLFPDYKGAIKSLGGWGGDFIMATGGEKNHQYFKEKGFHTIIPFSKMIK